MEELAPPLIRNQEDHISSRNNPLRIESADQSTTSLPPLSDDGNKSCRTTKSSVGSPSPDFDTPLPLLTSPFSGSRKVRKASRGSSNLDVLHVDEGEGSRGGEKGTRRLSLRSFSSSATSSRDVSHPLADEKVGWRRREEKKSDKGSDGDKQEKEGLTSGVVGVSGSEMEKEKEKMEMKKKRKEEEGIHSQRRTSPLPSSPPTYLSSALPGSPRSTRSSSGGGGAGGGSSGKHASSVPPLPRASDASSSVVSSSPYSSPISTSSVPSLSPPLLLPQHGATSPTNTTNSNGLPPSQSSSSLVLPAVLEPTYKSSSSSHSSSSPSSARTTSTSPVVSFSPPKAAAKAGGKEKRGGGGRVTPPTSSTRANSPPTTTTSSPPRRKGGKVRERKQDKEPLSAASRWSPYSVGCHPLPPQQQWQIHLTPTTTTSTSTLPLFPSTIHKYPHRYPRIPQEEGEEAETRTAAAPEEHEEDEPKKKKRKETEKRVKKTKKIESEERKDTLPSPSHRKKVMSSLTPPPPHARSKSNEEEEEGGAGGAAEEQNVVKDSERNRGESMGEKENEEGHRFNYHPPPPTSSSSSSSFIQHQKGKKKLSPRREETDRGNELASSFKKNPSRPPYSSSHKSKPHASIKNANSKVFIHEKSKEEMKKDFEKHTKASHREFLRLCRGGGLLGHSTNTPTVESDSHPPMPSFLPPHGKSEEKGGGGVSRKEVEVEVEEEERGKTRGQQNHNNHYADGGGGDLHRSVKGPEWIREIIENGRNSHEREENTSATAGGGGRAAHADEEIEEKASLMSLLAVSSFPQSSPLLGAIHPKMGVQKTTSSAPVIGSPLGLAEVWKGHGSPLSDGGFSILSREALGEISHLTFSSAHLPHLRSTVRAGGNEDTEDSMVFGRGTVGLAARERQKQQLAEMGIHLPPGGSEKNSYGGFGVGTTGGGGGGMVGTQSRGLPTIYSDHSNPYGSTTASPMTTMGGLPPPSFSKRAPGEVEVGSTQNHPHGGAGGDGGSPINTSSMSVFQRLHKTSKTLKTRPPVFCAVAQKEFEHHQQACAIRHMEANAAIHSYTNRHRRRRRRCGGRDGNSSSSSYNHHHSSSPTTPRAPSSPALTSAPPPSTSALPQLPLDSPSSHSAQAREKEDKDRPFSVLEFMALQRLIRFGMPMPQALDAVRQSSNPSALSATIGRPEERGNGNGGGAAGIEPLGMENERSDFNPGNSDAQGSLRRTKNYSTPVVTIRCPSRPDSEGGRRRTSFAFGGEGERRKLPLSTSPVLPEKTPSDLFARAPPTHGTDAGPATHHAKPPPPVLQSSSSSTTSSLQHYSERDRFGSPKKLPPSSLYRTAQKCTTTETGKTTTAAAPPSLLAFSPYAVPSSMSSAASGGDAESGGGGAAVSSATLPPPPGGLMDAFGYFSMHRAQPQYYTKLETLSGTIGGGGGNVAGSMYGNIGEGMKVSAGLSGTFGSGRNGGKRSKIPLSSSPPGSPSSRSRMREEGGADSHREKKTKRRREGGVSGDGKIFFPSSSLDRSRNGHNDGNTSKHHNNKCNNNNNKLEMKEKHGTIAGGSGTECSTPLFFYRTRVKTTTTMEEPEVSKFSGNSPTRSIKQSVSFH